MKITQTEQAEMAHRDPAAILYFIVHHSVAAPTLDITEISQMEQLSQGFVVVGYHAYCKKLADGSWVIQEGRTMDDIPAAAYGLNEPSYDLCVGGNYEPSVPGVPTNAIEDAVLNLVVERIKLVKSKCKNLRYLIGHRDVATIMENRGKDPANYATACPGDLLYAHLQELRNRTDLSIPTDLWHRK